MKNEAFYYGTTPNGRRATVCGIKNEDNTISFGIAVCNPKDEFNKKLARTISRGRAKNQRSSDTSVNTINTMVEFNNFAKQQIDAL